jgi:hypothetical protein
VRTPTGMMPIAIAEQLAEPIGYALGMIHSGLNQNTRFDPASVKRSVTIGMTDIGEIVFLTGSLAWVPGVRSGCD